MIKNLSLAFLALGFATQTFAASQQAPLPPLNSKQSKPTVAPTSAERYEATQDAWKGPLNTSDIQFTLLSGLAIIDPKAAVSVMGGFAKRIVDQGWVPDLSNQVFFEVMGGPAFVDGNAPFTYSLHLRWDFRYDADWTVYAVGGLGGNVTGVELGDRFALFPRFGIGAFRALNSKMALRGELSHEFIVVGATFLY